MWKLETREYAGGGIIVQNQHRTVYTINTQHAHLKT